MANEMPGQGPTGTGWQVSSQANWQANWKQKLNEVGRDVNTRARELVDEGNSRQFILQREGKEIVSVPLTVAAIVGGAAVLLAPAIAVFGAIAALLARVHARVEPRGRPGA
jgi:hypothetical protein